MKKCPNPTNNPNCKGTIGKYSKKGLCQSCAKCKEKIIRKCPNPKNNSKCKNIIKSRSSKLCMSCSHKEQKSWNTDLTKETDLRVKNTADKNTGKKRTSETKRKMRIAKEGNKHLLETKQKISKSLTGIKRSSKTKQKMKLAAYERIKNQDGQISPGYNSDSIIPIEKFGKKYGYNFQHAENGGEFKVIKYFADGYDKEKNVWLEWDEEGHYNPDGTLKNDDIRRQKEITECLDNYDKLCTFIRIRQKIGRITIYHNGTIEILTERFEF